MRVRMRMFKDMDEDGNYQGESPVEVEVEGSV
jgi:hypothetical protein